MIAKIIKGNFFKGLVLYNQKKVNDERAEIIGGNIHLRSDKTEEITNKFLQNSNNSTSKIKNKYCHIVLSFSPEDKEKMNLQMEQDIAKAYMEKMGYENSPYLVYKHKDEKHPHLHIITSRIQFNGKVVNDSLERKKSLNICRKLALDNNLIIVPEKAQMKSNSLSYIKLMDRAGDDKTVKMGMKNLINYNLKDSPSAEVFLNRMQRCGVKLKMNKSGNQIKGINFSYQNYDFKGSTLAKAFSWEGLNKKFNKDQPVDILRISDIINNGRLLDKEFYNKTDIEIDAIHSAYRGNKYEIKQSVKRGIDYDKIMERSDFYLLDNQTQSFIDSQYDNTIFPPMQQDPTIDIAEIEKAVEAIDKQADEGTSVAGVNPVERKKKKQKMGM